MSAKMFILNTFQFRGMIYRTSEEGATTIKISESELKEEMAKGKHPKTGRWFSPILNHCAPANEAAKRIINGDMKQVEAEEEEEKSDADLVAEKERAEVEAIREEFRKLGKAFDNRWGYRKLQQELVRVKRETGA